MKEYDWNQISSCLREDTRRYLHAQIVDEISSTNDGVVQAFSQEIYPVVCLAETQLAGRGRNGRSWCSAQGESITLSVGWPFYTSDKSLSGLSLVVGLVIARVLSRWVVNVSVKWPNDVLVGGNKIAGVLIQTRLKTSGPILAVIGIGLNYRLSESSRQRVGQSCIDVAQAVTGRDELPSRNQIVGELLSELVDACEKFDQHGLAAFAEEWRQFDACTGRELYIVEGDSVTEAFALGIADDGALRVRVAAGERLLYAADVSIRVK